MYDVKNKKKNVYLHLGMPKTGSTAIQSSLQLFEKQCVLKNYSFTSCVDFWSSWVDGIVEFSNTQYDVHPCITKIKNFLENTQMDNIIFSSELFLLTLNNNQIVIDDKFIKLFENVFENYNVNVMVYLRRQDVLVESLWAQDVKVRTTYHSFDSYKYSIQNFLFYKGILDSLSCTFGKENISVRVYERENLIKGDIVADFLQWLGLDFLPLPSLSAMGSNVSLSPEELRIVHAYGNNVRLNDEQCIHEENSLDEKFSFGRIDHDVYIVKKMLLKLGKRGENFSYNLLEYMFNNTSNKYSFGFMQSHERSLFLKLFELDNAAVAREYLAKDDGKLFNNAFPQKIISTENPSISDLIVAYSSVLSQISDDVAQLKHTAARFPSYIGLQKNLVTESKDMPKLYMSLPNLPEKKGFIKAIDNIWDSGHVSNNGQYVKLFEETTCLKWGVKHAFAVNNGTTALMLCAKALGLSGEVIMPAFTFVAMPQALSWIGLKPVFVDVDPQTGMLLPDAVKAAVNEKTSAILGVHLWGNVQYVEELRDIATENNLKLFFDASHAAGCSYKGKSVANLGDCACFSLYATNILHATEGGLITTNDDELAKKIRSLRDFGICGEDQYVGEGINAKMCELCAAVALSSMQNLNLNIKENKIVYDDYVKAFERLQGIDLMPKSEHVSSNYHYVVARVNENAKIERDNLYAWLKNNNIFCKRYYSPGCHKLEPYKNDAIILPNTDILCDQCICLPASQQQISEYVPLVVSKIQNLISN